MRPQLAAAALTARTVALDVPDADLVAFAGDDGHLFVSESAGLAGRGVALRVPAAQADAALAAIRTVDEVGRPGTGPVAMGALPFWSPASAELVVPRVVLGRGADGTAWLTTIGDGVPARPEVSLTPPPDAFTLTASRPHAEWCDVVAGAVRDIRAGRFRKIVLAREVIVEANRDILPRHVLRRLRALYPSCMHFSMDGFVGASPELLVARCGRAVRSHPLAGTIPRSGDPVVDRQLADSLLASSKDREEHRLVVDAVAARLAGRCRSLAVPDAPSIVPLRNVSHLGTVLEGELASPESALELALDLHPTPAVGGAPAPAALQGIAAVEGFDRGRYAGPVGWVDARGDGEWAVGIRAAQLEGRRARLVAGVGIVADSDPEAELAETQLKLQALLAAVVRP